MPELGDVYWGGPVVPTRSRSLTFEATGSLSNYAVVQLVSSQPGQPPPESASTSSKFSAQCYGLGPNPLNPPTMTVYPGTYRAMGWCVEVSDGLGNVNSQDNRNAYVVPAPVVPGPIYSASSDGTWTATFSIDRVDTYFEVYFLTDGVRGADGSVNYGGPASDDVNPRGIGVCFYEVVPAGAKITVSMSVTAAYGSASTSLTTTVGFAFQLPNYYARLSVQGQTGPKVTGSGTGTWTQAPWNSSGPTSPLSRSDADGVVTTSVSNHSVQVSIQNGNVVQAPTGTATLDAEPDRLYKAVGHAFAMDGDYPGSLTLNAQGVPAGQTSSCTLDPTGNFGFKQSQWVASCEIRGDDYVLGSASEWDKVRLSIGGLEAAGEDRSEWRCMIAGKSYPALRLAHAAVRALDAPTQVGASWVLTYSGLPGNLGGYAYLRVRLRTDQDGETVRVSTDSDPNKTYTITTVGTGLRDYDVDLLAPDSPTSDDDPDLDDSPYTLRNDGLKHKDGPAWGIGRVRSITVSGGTNLVVQSLSQVRLDEKSVLDSTPAFNDWALVQDDESYHADGSVGSVPIVQGTRGAVLNADMRRALIEPSSTRFLATDASGNPLWIYGGRTLSNLEFDANAVPGVTCDHQPYSATDGFHAIDGSEGRNFIDGGDIYYAGFVGWLLGGGRMWTGETCASTLGKPIDGTLTTLLAQVRWDEVIGFPGMGDVWASAGYDVPTLLRGGIVLRALVDGIVYDQDGKPIANQQVSLTDSTGSLTTLAVTNERGRFRMSVPQGAPGEKDATVTSGDASGSFTGDWDPGQSLGSDDEVQNRWSSRRWHRAVFRAPRQRTRGGIALLTTPDGTYWRAAIEADGLVVRTALLGGPKLGWQTVATVSQDPRDGWPCLAWNPLTNRATLVWERDGQAYESHSDSDGEHWSEPQMSATIPGGRMPRRATDEDGNQLEFAIVNDGGSGAGKLVAAYRGYGDLAWSDPFDVLDDGGAALRVDGDPDAPAGFDIEAGRIHDGRWSLTLFRPGEDGPSDWFSVDDARRFRPAS